MRQGRDLLDPHLSTDITNIHQPELSMPKREFCSGNHIHKPKVEFLTAYHTSHITHHTRDIYIRYIIYYITYKIYYIDIVDTLDILDIFDILHTRYIIYYIH